MESFFAGMCLKLYDDLVIDNPILTNPVYTAMLRTLLVLFFTVVMTRDFWLAVSFALGNLAVYLVEPAAYASPHEQSLLVFLPVVLVMSWSHRLPFTLRDGIVFFVLGCIRSSDAYFMPEEASLRKWGVRGLLTVVLSTGLLTTPSASPTLVHGLTSLIGYLATSSVMQMLMLTGLVPLHVSPPVPA